MRTRTATLSDDRWTGTPGSGEVHAPPRQEIDRIDLKVAQAAITGLTELYGSFDRVRNMTVQDVMDAFAAGV